MEKRAASTDSLWAKRRLTVKAWSKANGQTMAPGESLTDSDTSLGFVGRTALTTNRETTENSPALKAHRFDRSRLREICQVKQEEYTLQHLHNRRKRQESWQQSIAAARKIEQKLRAVT